MEDLTIFENWLEKHLPEVVKDLNPPATMEEIQLLEKTIGRSLPEDFISLYQWHNGQMGNAPTGLWYGLEFMSIKGIDLDPDKLGIVGQVINFGRDENRKIVANESISDFLFWLIEELSDGNFNINIEDDGGRSLNMLTPKSGHFLDALAKIYPG